MRPCLTPFVAAFHSQQEQSSLPGSTCGNAALHLRRLNEKRGKRQTTTTSPAFSASCGSKRRSLLLGLLASTAMVRLAALAQAPEQATNAPVTSPDYPGVTCQVLQVPTRDGTQLRTRRALQGKLRPAPSQPEAAAPGHELAGV
jgi:hypothetical protein